MQKSLTAAALIPNRTNVVLTVVEEVQNHLEDAQKPATCSRSVDQRVQTTGHPDESWSTAWQTRLQPISGNSDRWHQQALNWQMLWFISDAERQLLLITVQASSGVCQGGTGVLPPMAVHDSPQLTTS